MAFPLKGVLTVDMDVLHIVDTLNPQNLLSMWKLFTRCAKSVEQGRRLENMSWRLWSRETLCCISQDMTLGDYLADTSELEVPALSRNVDSVDDEANKSRPPCTLRQNSYHRSRGLEQRLTRDMFREMLVSIVKDRRSLWVPGKPFHEQDGPSQERLSPQPNTKLVGGITASHHLVPQTPPRSAPSIPKPAQEPAANPSKSEKPVVFVLGGSSSGQDQSPDNTRAVPSPLAKRTRERFHSRSYEETSEKSGLAHPKANESLKVQKKRASSSELVDNRTTNVDAAVADDSKTDCMAESAIDDDDDSSTWEDSIEDSNKSSIDVKTYFKRVVPKADLTSRSSLITTMLSHIDGASVLAQASSQSVSPNDSDEAHS